MMSFHAADFYWVKDFRCYQIFNKKRNDKKQDHFEQFKYQTGFEPMWHA